MRTFFIISKRKNAQKGELYELKELEVLRQERGNWSHYFGYNSYIQQAILESQVNNFAYKAKYRHRGNIFFQAVLEFFNEKNSSK